MHTLVQYICRLLILPVEYPKLCKLTTRDEVHGANLLVT
jgi:hypothetical protein